MIIARDKFGTVINCIDGRVQLPVRKAIQVVRSWNLPVKVIGVWVNENWKIEVVDVKEVS